LVLRWRCNAKKYYQKNSTGFIRSSPPNKVLLEAVKQKTPNGKLIDPGEVAKYILWLSEGGAQFVSGSVIDFDPAYTLNRWPL